MALVPLNEVLEQAQEEKYAVGAFNINNDVQAGRLCTRQYAKLWRCLGQLEKDESEVNR